MIFYFTKPNVQVASICGWVLGEHLLGCSPKLTFLHMVTSSYVRVSFSFLWPWKVSLCSETYLWAWCEFSTLFSAFPFISRVFLTFFASCSVYFPERSRKWLWKVCAHFEVASILILPFTGICPHPQLLTLCFLFLFQRLSLVHLKTYFVITNTNLAF